MLFERKREKESERIVYNLLEGMRGGCRGLLLYEHTLQQTMRPRAGERSACLMEVMVV